MNTVWKYRVVIHYRRGYSLHITTVHIGCGVSADVGWPRKNRRKTNTKFRVLFQWCGVRFYEFTLTERMSKVFRFHGFWSIMNRIESTQFGITGWPIHYRRGYSLHITTVRIGCGVTICSTDVEWPCKIVGKQTPSLEFYFNDVVSDSMHDRTSKIFWLTERINNVRLVTCTSISWILVNYNCMITVKSTQFCRTNHSTQSRIYLGL